MSEPRMRGAKMRAPGGEVNRRAFWKRYRNRTFARWPLAPEAQTGATIPLAPGLRCMNSSRRTTLLLSALTSAAFWLLVDTPSRLASRRFQLDGYDPWPSDLAVVPAWKLLVLLGVTVLVFYALARTVRAFGRTPRQRRLLWPLALVMLWGGWHYGSLEVWERADPFANDAYQPIRFERSQLAGSAWVNLVSTSCGYFNKEVIVFESDTRAIRRSYGGFVFDPLVTVYLLLDVWPHGEWTASGEVHDGVITWRDDNGYVSRERLRLADGELTLTWID
ncbi:hypothetical protein [Rubricoccus marinus]|nr:hypothetical protein [Rubricoccus marinus]